jgi:hypothetical protein
MRSFGRFGKSGGVLVGAGLVVLSLGLNVPVANAQDTATPTAAPDSISPVSAPKTKSTAGKSYFVEFRARSAASYGHMYVLFGQVNGRGEIVRSDIAGLHPAGDANNCENCSVVSWTLGHFLFVPSETGASDGDLEEKYVADRYRVMLDAAEYKRVSAYIKKLRAENPQWNALWRNCVSFGRDIAVFMGLKTPAFIWIEPKSFVESLREMNGGRPQGPLKDAAPGRVRTSAVATPVSARSEATNSEATPSLPQRPKKQPVAGIPSPAR